MTRDSIRLAIAEAISELTGFVTDKIDDADDLVDDLGVDSMSAIGLLVAIEDRLERTVPDGSEGSLAGVRTVGELLDRLVTVFALEENDRKVASL